MLPKHSSPRAARDTFFGILLGLVISYFLFSAPDLFEGDFFLNWKLIANLSLIGILVVGWSWYENARG